jgi:hypothetical protein
MNGVGTEKKKKNTEKTIPDFGVPELSGTFENSDFGGPEVKEN